MRDFDPLASISNVLNNVLEFVVVMDRQSTPSKLKIKST